MNWFSKYPYLDEHELNLDWLIAKMRSLEIKFDEFKVVNNITFSGQWDITKQYPAWTIVSDNNIGYVSIQPVPVGVVLTNTDYWVEVIDYTAQIAGLQQRVVDLENEVADINAELDNLGHKRYVFIGDSYNTTDVPLGGVAIVPWYSKLIEYLGIDASDYYQIGHSGSGFVHGSEPFKTLLNLVSAGIADKDSITDVVVLGGINDNSETLSDLNDALDDFIARATALFPNAIITIGFISWTRDASTRLKILDMLPYYEDKAKYSNVRILANAYMFYHNYGAQYQSDGHPNVLGTEAIAQGIANFLKHGFTNVHWHSSFAPITFDAALNVTNGSISIAFDQVNEKVVTKLSSSSYFQSSGFSVNTGTSFTLGTFSYQYADFSPIAPINGKMYLYDSVATKFYNVDIRVKFEHDTITIEPLQTQDSGTFIVNNITLCQLLIPEFFETPVEYC